jgi:hypothetical protein
MLRAAQIAHDRMVLAEARTPNTEALELARRSEQWLRKYLSSGSVDDTEKQQVVITGMNVANWLIREYQYDDGIRLLRDTIDTGRATNQMSQVGAAHIVLARALRAAGDLDGALAASQEAVRLTDPQGQDTGPGRVRTYRLALAVQGISSVRTRKSASAAPKKRLQFMSAHWQSHASWFNAIQVTSKRAWHSHPMPLASLPLSPLRIRAAVWPYTTKSLPTLPRLRIQFGRGDRKSWHMAWPVPF